MTDPPVIADVALAGRASLRRAARRRQPGRLPRGRGRAQAARQPARSSELLRLATRVYLERADRVVAIGETMRERLEAKGARPERDRRDPELGRHVRSRAAAARQRLGARARAGRQVRRHALRQHRPRPGPRRAHPRGDVPPRPRRPPDRVDRRRRAPRRARGAGASCSRSTRCASWATSRASCLPSRSRRPTSTSSGSRAGLAGYVVPSRLYGILAVGRPVIVAADETARRRASSRGRLRRRRPARAARAAGARDPARPRRRARPRGDGRARPRVGRGEGGPQRRGRPLSGAAPRGDDGRRR